MEEKREWLDELQDWFEGCGLQVKQRKEEQGPNCPLAMAVKHQSELSIPSSIGKKSNEAKSPIHSVAGVERSVYRKGWDEAMQSEFDGHMKTGAFHMVDRVHEGGKPVPGKLNMGFRL